MSLQNLHRILETFSVNISFKRNSGSYSLKKKLHEPLSVTHQIHRLSASSQMLENSHKDQLRLISMTQKDIMGIPLHLTHARSEDHYPISITKHLLPNFLLEMEM